jgi:DNA-binding transcriptional MerR regulator
MEGLIVIAAGQSPRQPLTTATVSVASGYSAQQVRDLEAQGVIPPAPRAANGYREFSSEHLRALRAYRNLAEAIGPVQARSALREVRTLPPDQAVALVNSFHITLARERDDALAAQRALQMIRAEALDEAAPRSEDAMTITELAGALGVRTSTLRFWEKAGLVIPDRVTSRVGAARRYPLPAIREARITAALRAAGYRIPDVQNAMRSIRQLHDVNEPYKALENRVEAIAQRTLALLRAGADLADIIAVT